jgi:hypothetical protein
MGVIYTILPLDDHMRSSLDQFEVDYPDGLDGRCPTHSELRDILAALPLTVSWTTDSIGYTAEIETPEGKSTLLRAPNREPGGTETSCEFYFSKGSETVIRLVVNGVAAVVGPLVIFPDTCDGIEVCIGTTPRE